MAIRRLESYTIALPVRRLVHATGQRSGRLPEQFFTAADALRRPVSTEDDRERLAGRKFEFDQCWDLLHQRRALRKFGDDASTAKVRPAKTVQNYEQ